MDRSQPFRDETSIPAFQCAHTAYNRHTYPLVNFGKNLKICELMATSTVYLMLSSTKSLFLQRGNPTKVRLDIRHIARMKASCALTDTHPSESGISSENDARISSIMSGKRAARFRV